jgi:hypothetical protein
MNESDKPFIRETILPDAVKPYELSPEGLDYVPEITELARAERILEREGNYMSQSSRLRSELEIREALAARIQQYERELITMRYLQRIIIERKLRGPGKWLRRLLGGA